MVRECATVWLIELPVARIFACGSISGFLASSRVMSPTSLCESASRRAGTVRPAPGQSSHCTPDDARADCGENARRGRTSAAWLRNGPSTRCCRRRYGRMPLDDLKRRCGEALGHRAPRARMRSTCLSRRATPTARSRAALHGSSRSSSTASTHAPYSAGLDGVLELIAAALLPARRGHPPESPARAHACCVLVPGGSVAERAVRDADFP